MRNKLAKRIRKLQRIYGYTSPMYQTMKHIVYRMNSDQRGDFADEVERIIETKKV